MSHEALIETARYRARLADGPSDLARSLALRSRVFRAGRGDDRDAFDDRCRHLLVEERATGGLLCSLRLLGLTSGRDIGASYSAQFYDLAALQGHAAPMLEVGRFCIAPGVRDADILRLAWAALGRIVDAEHVEMLFGCSSFDGLEPGAHADAFALLAARHLAPARWRPRIKAPGVYRFAAGRGGDPKCGTQAMPPLLRSYLAMGGWVSDHAVIDRDLGTLHVFTGLEVRAVPPARARALRALAGA